MERVVTRFVRPCSICGDLTNDEDRLAISVPLPEGALLYDVHARCFVGVFGDGQGREIATRYRLDGSA